MSRTQRLRRRRRRRPAGAVVAASAVIGALTLAGCSAGQITQTATQIPAVTGASANIGPVAVRNAQIEFSAEAEGANIYPVGGSAPLLMSIANSGGQADKLISVTSPVAGSVEIGGNPTVPPGRVLLVGSEEEGAEPAAGAPSATATPTPSGATPTPGGATPTPGGATPTPGAGTPTESAAAPTTSVQVPTPSAAPQAPGDEIGGSGQEPGETPGTGFPPTPSGGEAGEAALGGATVVLTGLKEDIRAGLTYPVVLTFERAGQVTVQVPVGYPEEPREDEPAE